MSMILTYLETTMTNVSKQLNIMYRNGLLILWMCMYFCDIYCMRGRVVSVDIDPSRRLQYNTDANAVNGF